MEGDTVRYLAEVDDTACGVTIDWGQQMGFYDSPIESEIVAESVATTAGVVFIPALCGFGAPINDPTASAGFLGLVSDQTFWYVSWTHFHFESETSKRYQIRRNESPFSKVNSTWYIIPNISTDPNSL